MRTSRWLNAGVAVALVVSVGCAGTSDPPPDAAQPDDAGPEGEGLEGEDVQEGDQGDDGDRPSEPEVVPEDGSDIAVSGPAGAVDGVVVEEPEIDHTVASRDSEDGGTRLVVTADITGSPDTDELRPVSLGVWVVACTVPDGQMWATWRDRESGAYPCFGVEDVPNEFPEPGERLEMDLEPGTYRISYTGDDELRTATRPRNVDLEEGQTVEYALALQPLDEPRPGPTYRFSLTTDEEWVYNVTATVPLSSAGGVDAFIDDSPPGRAELLVAAAPPYGRVSGATPGRNPPPQTAQLQMTTDVDLDVTETGCLTGTCGRDEILSLYEPQGNHSVVCSYDRPQLTCQFPGATLQDGQEPGADGGILFQAIGKGDEDVLHEALVDQFMSSEATMELLFDGAGGPDGECTVQLRPDRTVALTDNSTCAIGPPV